MTIIQLTVENSVGFFILVSYNINVWFMSAASWEASFDCLKDSLQIIETWTVLCMCLPLIEKVKVKVFILRCVHLYMIIRWPFTLPFLRWTPTAACNCLSNLGSVQQVTHYSQADWGSVEYEALLHMTGTGNWTPDILISVLIFSSHLSYPAP